MILYSIILNFEFDRSKAVHISSECVFMYSKLIGLIEWMAVIEFITCECKILISKSVITFI